ncbi:sugar phosphate isomerase/epimerase family protein [Brachybacterium kimchii]|uniref:Sugar phosphate isomerase/epimerase n=1 Tax=Brachybacterium kimchii TaxID=2942909 RepID=A0ABY4N0X7_9MICO|nr:sugar phosphate isomerase/epimerase [Brachybacterium kimchii]UQN28183.1 sugar phosphate isomerase/epimerase [Brachybacterium kimchii]
MAAVDISRIDPSGAAPKAAAVASAPTSAPDASAPRVGIAPDSWGVWNAIDPAQPSPEQYVREVAEAGYRWTELGPYGYLGTDAGRLAEQLAEHDLSLSAGTVFTPLQEGEDALERIWQETRQVGALVRALGGEHVIAIPTLWERGADGHVQGPRTFDDAQWGLFTRGVDELGRRLAEEFGLALQFHSHAESPVGSGREVVELLERTDPRHVNLCVDTGHLAYYQVDCERLLREHPERVGYLHLKQVDPELLAEVLKNDIPFAEAVQRGVMVEPPYGVPGYAPILELAAAARPGVFAVVEQDMYPVADFADPVRIARRTREHIAGCGAPVRFR